MTYAGRAFISSAESYAAWVVKWWRWINSIPRAVNPAFDTTGKDCAQNQAGPVWFLAGTKGGSAERTCTIPAGKGLVFPIINKERALVDDPQKFKGVEDLIKDVKSDIDSVRGLEIHITEGTLKDMRISRVLSPPYDVTYIPNGIYELQLKKQADSGQIKTNVPIQTKAVSDGYWVFAGPLDSGEYSFEFCGEVPGFKNEVIYNLTVQDA